MHLHKMQTDLYRLQNLWLLEEKFDQVSDPDHADYGKFLTQEEAENLVAPATEHVDAVFEWLRQFRRVKLTRFSDRVTVSTTSNKFDCSEIKRMTKCRSRQTP